jgi:polyhydroxyalkanoate synthesis regulator phasin
MEVKMKDTIEELFLLGLGAARITRKNVEKTINKFSKSKIISNKEASELVKRILAQAERLKDKLAKEGKKELSDIKVRTGNAGVRLKNKISKKIVKTVRQFSRGL